MSWSLRWAKRGERQFSKLDRQRQRIIGRWLSKHVDGRENPRARGRALGVNLANYLRYRIGEYRVICELRDSELIVLALGVAHRSKVYDGKNTRLSDGRDTDR